MKVRATCCLLAEGPIRLLTTRRQEEKEKKSFDVGPEGSINDSGKLLKKPRMSRNGDEIIAF